MRHLNKKGRLNRNRAERMAMFRNLSISLIKYQRIKTTLAKAKFLRAFVEPIITIAKNSPDALFAKREVFRKLGNREAVVTLFKDLAPLYKGVNGGYTRIMPLSTRVGDGAEMAVIELTKRTISDEDLVRAPKLNEKTKESLKEKVAKAVAKKQDKKSGKKAEETAKKGKKAKAEKADEVKAEKPAEVKEEKHYAAPDIDAEKKEQHFVEDVKKEKAKTESKKLSAKGLFKNFRRKSM
ncbi:MAG TPA: 50S ribosomal protein L17 [Candidatus Omnitrophota bacterium]|nr:50S ribosomal protein L17 [Candidatus Omnitrophota bacterium]HPS20258.1 50S ribosomal protein L17 [Candidatus Omnitrophota bacterium]